MKERKEVLGRVRVRARWWARERVGDRRGTDGRWAGGRACELLTGLGLYSSNHREVRRETAVRTKQE